MKVEFTTTELDAVADRIAEKVAAKLLDHLPGLLRTELARQRDQEVLFSQDVARRYGKSVEALNAWLRRSGGAHVAAIATTRNGKRCWRRVDLELVEADRKHGNNR